MIEASIRDPMGMDGRATLAALVVIGTGASGRGLNACSTVL